MHVKEHSNQILDTMRFSAFFESSSLSKKMAPGMLEQVKTHLRVAEWKFDKDFKRFGVKHAS
jgi:hypothetical protein